MRCTRVLLSLILIPALIAGSADTLPSSVRKLLVKPRYGPAKITLVDGTHLDGAIFRVTTQFVTVRKSSAGCENIDLKRIAAVEAREVSPYGDDGSFVDAAPYLAFLALTSLIWVPWALGSKLKRSLTPRDHIFGKWQSVSPQGEKDTIEFREQQLVTRSAVAYRTGRYRISDGNVHLNRDSDGEEETLPFRFDCHLLVLNQTSGQLKMLNTLVQRRAAEPIVGHWQYGEGWNPGYWDFRSDGTFRAKVVVGDMMGCLCCLV